MNKLILMAFAITTIDLIILPKVFGRGTKQEMLEALNKADRKDEKWKFAPLSGPKFDNSEIQNVTVKVGGTAVLSCKILYAEGKTISWIRSRDLHLLTVNQFTYTGDNRFKALHSTGSDEWLLKIFYVQHFDQGQYECQVATTPPMSHTIWLKVYAEPMTIIPGGPDIYINHGSTMNLTCFVLHSPQPPDVIDWHRNNELISYDSPRGGITIVTENSLNSTSRLLIQNASLSDSGNYTCSPSGLMNHSVIIHIIHAENHAAIHEKNGTATSSSSSGNYDLITSQVVIYCSFISFIHVVSAVQTYSSIYLSPILNRLIYC